MHLFLAIHPDLTRICKYSHVMFKHVCISLNMHSNVQYSCIDSSMHRKHIYMCTALQIFECFEWKIYTCTTNCKYLWNYMPTNCH